METRCKRVIPKNKYERVSPDIVQWWQQLFCSLEEDASIKPAWRLSLLKEILPGRILETFLSILSVKREKFELDPSLHPKDDELKDIFLHDADRSYLASGTNRSVISSTDISYSVRATDGFVGDEVEQHKSNPYLNFFKRRPDRAAIWRRLPPLSWQEMSLTQKADTVAESIASDFVNWIKNVGGYEDIPMDIHTIISMFEIGAQINSATSLNVTLKEMPSVTQRIASCCNLPNVSRRSILYRELMRDQKASREKPKIAAFGRRLPTKMQVRPPKKAVYKKWVQCERVPEKLETMAAVWQGITHLKSTRAFCEYLYTEHPEIKPPKYLVDSKMMDPNKLKEESLCSIRSADSFGNVSRVSFTLLK